jgi:translation initiation factor IF-2
MRNDEILQDRIECHSLKHVKTEINTVKKNVEFGISFKELQLEVKRGDKIVCYDIKMVKSPIEWNLGF